MAMSIQDVMLILNWVFSLLFLLGLFLISYNFIRKSPWINLPPGPPCLPIFGSIPFSDPHVYKAMNIFYKKYGEVFTTYFGHERIVVVSGHEAIKELLVKQWQAFSARPNDIFAGTSENKGIVSSSGELWREQRRYVLHVLRDLGLGKSVMELKIQEETEFFIRKMAEMVKVPFDPKPVIQQSITNVITSLAFGKRMEYNDPLFDRLLEALNFTLSTFSPGSTSSAFPIVRHLPGDFFGYKKALKEFEYMKDQYRKWIEEHKMSNQPEETTNLIGAYVKMLRKEKNNPNSTYSEGQLIYIMFDLYAAGSDTTTTTLTWAVAFMVLNPIIQSRVQGEIDAIIGQGRLPKLTDRPLMPYTEACLHESQRLGEIAGLNLPHSTVEDTTFRGFTIPKGTSMVANFHSVHADPKIWPKPATFDPSRFLDDDGKLVRKEELTPFSMGKRICLGEGLARMELFLYFTSMMQRFTFKPSNDKDGPSYEGEFAFTYQPKPYKVLIELRN